MYVVGVYVCCGVCGVSICMRIWCVGGVWVCVCVVCVYVCGAVCVGGGCVFDF